MRSNDHKPDSTSPTSVAPLHTLSACDLRDGLQEGRFTSAEIVDALIQRRDATDGKLHSFIVSCDDAMIVAEEADKARKRGEIAGPLHGLPMTIKDSVDLEGYDSTMGIRSRVGKPAAKDAVLVAELRRQSAIFLGKTNVPQALLAQETENEIFGRTNNPWDLSRTPGGSSGGEAAAVAAGLVPLGIGTDIGGSIRMPAHFCGIVGLKPTLDVWSNRGSNSAIKGQEVVRAQIGCLTRTVGDTKLLWDSVDRGNQAKSDPLVPPYSATETAQLQGMTIGIVEGDEFLAPCESIQRAVRLSRKALEEAGAKVVAYSPVGSKEILATWLAALSSDNGRTMLESLGNDEVIAPLKPSMNLLKIPKAVRKTLSGLLSVVGESRLAMLLDIIGEKTITELWQLTQHRSQMRLTEFDNWNRAGLDALVCPPHVVPAMAHRTSGDFVLSLGAMFRWTLFGFPAGVVPVTRVEARETYYPASDRVAKRAASIVKGSEGMPVGVQVVAKPFCEHKLLAAMMGIESGVNGLENFPSTPIDPA